jgi:uncharacterized membrane protein HdeD (DUF308 family)
MSQQGAMQSGGAAFGERALAAGGLAFELAKKWWVLLLRGTILIVLGLLAFVYPPVWVTFLGAYMLIDGMSMLMSGFSDQPAGQSRWPLIIIGVLGLIAGLYLLFEPVRAGLVLTYVIAAWAIIGGILTIISALRLREVIDNEWWLVLSGILGIIFGVLVFTGGAVGDDREGGAAIGVIGGFLAISWVFAIFAIVVGILSIVLALRVRDFGTRIGAVT